MFYFVAKNMPYLCGKQSFAITYHCNCSKERVEKVLISLGKKELQELIDEGKEVELNCHFCNTDYRFTVEELKKIQRARKTDMHSRKV